MNRWLLRIVVAATLLLSTGCERPHVSGTIVGKHHEAEQTVWIPQRVGKVTMLQRIHHPERWYVVVRTGDGEEVSRLVSREFFTTAAEGAAYAD